MQEKTNLKKESPERNFFRASAADFKKIPGSPIAYWVSTSTFDIFDQNEPIGKFAEGKVGLQTGDNDRFLRLWFEVGFDKIQFNAINREVALKCMSKWFSYNKGGEFRKWFGNKEFIVNWENDGYEVRNNFNDKGELRSRPQNVEFYFKEAISWSDITCSSNSFRMFAPGCINDAVGHSAFGGSSDWKLCLLAYCNNKFVNKITKILNPTMHFHIGYFNKLPYAHLIWNDKNAEIAKKCIDLTKIDWNSYETSWDFEKLPLLSVGSGELKVGSEKILSAYQSLRDQWKEMTMEMQKLEKENNRIFIEAYGLQDELTPDVPLEEITLTCNPYYRYSRKVGKGAVDSGKQEMNREEEEHDSSTNHYTHHTKHFPVDEDLEAKLLEDTMKEFISYAVGCMFGRYSLDKPGLVLANQGESYEDYLKQVPEPCFEPDDDNVIPILDEGWFTDDIVERFKQFLKVSFGAEHYEENLRFIEDAIGKDIRKFFLKDFYKYHVKMYKKRPIYWMFSSPKGSFNALIYMHRYRSDLVSIVLNDYLREYRHKLSIRMDNLKNISDNPASGKRDKTLADKELDKIRKVIRELDDYEKEILYPLATRKMEIDLDDGVKSNYPEFGKALAKIPGLSVV